MTIDIRATRPEELRRAAGTMAIALMNAPPSDEAWERSRPSWEEMPSFSAWDDGRCVGHAGQFIVDTVIPGGGRLATGAVTRVGVITTHRRRGIATGLMEALIHDAVDRGLVLMSLRASETTIYERYGFGLAGESCSAELIPDRARPIGGADTTGSFRLLDPDTIVDTVGVLYDRVALRRAGAITRPTDSWFRRYFREAIDESSASFVAVHSDADGTDDGYVHYHVDWDDHHADGPTGKGGVHDLFGVSDAVELALWALLCEVDLVTRWRMNGRPIDDLVRRAAHDTRAYRVRSVDDEQWLRIIDVDAALSGRTYQPADGSVTIRVHDPLLARNDGTWSVSADGARRVRTAPELTADIATLSAAYLGGAPWSQLAGVGKVDVADPGAVALADALFHGPIAPFCGTFF